MNRWQRRWWRLRQWLLHPIREARWFKHTVLDFPRIGDLITYHDEGPYRVLHIDDVGDLDIEIDEHVVNVNWAHCCGKYPRR